MGGADDIELLNTALYENNGVIVKVFTRDASTLMAALPKTFMDELVGRSNQEQRLRNSATLTFIWEVAAKSRDADMPKAKLEKLVLNLITDVQQQEYEDNYDEELN